ncbi:MAG: Dam family site-specific DNA-(adenine-N6)-methyltransferase, partial [Cyanobacteria bacterium J06641_5]
MRPFLKWAGGKRQLVPELRRYVPGRYQTYYEPFVGAGALLLELQPKRAFINDRNRELIDCYEAIRDSLEELLAQLQVHKNEKEYYYSVRAWDREVGYSRRGKCQRAARILFLNKTCF